MLFIMVLSFSSEIDRDKFDLIYKKYRNLMLHKAYDILKDPHLAEDAVSDAFLRIYKNIRKISDPLSNQSVAFIITIVKNTALTIYRKAGRARGESIDSEALDGVADGGIDVESSVITDIEAERIYMLIDGLSERNRQVFLLKYAHGYSHGEIGKMLGMAEGNVTVTLHRAKKVLMGLLRENANAND